MIHSAGSLPKAIHICFWSRTDFLEKFPPNFWNETFDRPSNIPHVGTRCCVGLAACILSILITPDLNVTMITADFVLAEIVLRLATQIAANLYGCLSIGTLCDIVNINLTSVTAYTNATGTKRSRSMSSSLGNNCRIH